MDDLLLLPQRNNGHLLIQYPTNHFLILVELAGREDVTSVARTAVSRTATSSVDDRNCYFWMAETTGTKKNRSVNRTDVPLEKNAEYQTRIKMVWDTTVLVIMDEL